MSSTSREWVYAGFIEGVPTDTPEDVVNPNARMSFKQVYDSEQYTRINDRFFVKITGKEPHQLVQFIIHESLLDESPGHHPPT